MTWTCEHIEARLSDYIDGLLNPDERHAFDIRRERNPVDADQIQFFRRKNHSWPMVVATITPHE